MNKLKSKELSVITRYTRPEMGELWTPEARFQCLLDVELAVAQAQAKLKINRTLW